MMRIMDRAEPRTRRTTESWITRGRDRAWRRFQETPPPESWVETWKKVPFDTWRLDSLTADSSGLEPPLTNAALIPDRKGVELMSLREACERHRDLAAPFLAERASRGFAKLEAASLASWDEGVFLRVPRGTRLERPVRLLLRPDSSKAFSFPRVLVVLEEGAEADIIEEHASDEGLGPHVSIAFSRVALGRGAKGRIFYVQDLPPTASHFWHQRTALGSDARLEHYSLALGSKVHKSELRVALEGRGARADLKGVAVGQGGQVFDCRTHQLHRAPDGSSELEYRSVLLERARSNYRGAIRIERDAPRCDAYQQNRNLLLSDSARAESTPVLEILPDEVRCTHGATAGPIDPEELFYLTARGIPEPEAKRMLILGFLAPVLTSLPGGGARRRVLGKILGPLGDLA